MLVAVLTTLVIGCQSAPEVWTSEHISGRDALVIHAVKATSDRTARLAVIWNKLIQKKNEKNSEFKIDAYGFVNVASDVWPIDKIGKMNYGITKLEAGEYLLSEINYSHKLVINFEYQGPFASIAKVLYKDGPDKSQFAEYMFLGRKSLGMKYSFAFRIEPGEIIYIGDMYIDASSFPVASIKIENNLEAARNLTNLHPNLRTRLKYRALRDLSSAEQ